MREELLEKLLYLSVSTFLNLIIFSFLSYLLTINVKRMVNNTPINLYVELPKPMEEKVNLTRGSTGYEAKKGKGINREGKKKLATSTVEQPPAEKGSVPNSKNQSTQESSILSQIEEKVKGRYSNLQEEGIQKVQNIGDISATVTEKGVSLEGLPGNRGIAYSPPLPKIVSDEPLSTLKIEVWIDPDGNVIKAQIVKRSGMPSVDARLLYFVKSIKFEPISSNVIQRGIISFKFRGG
ncbi:TonB family protein [Thermocrinis minervae]|uniref:Protein TonB n=1 Tax=Thermocrinis minervae TaxID=381751 RepID=A0A1M6SDB1_9AQUI|nr:TonB family protein [Thermocrinis minervae]SHK42721.1 protein TonB [Thermocrinis minervae]